jgi:hypothetical protein
MRFRMKLLPAIIFVGALLVQTPIEAAAAQDDSESLIIQTDGSLTELTEAIESLGGTVTSSPSDLAVAAEHRRADDRPVGSRFGG